MHAKAALLCLCMAVAGCLWAAASASAYETNGVAVSEFATGFHTVNTVTGKLGPIGVALDHQNRLYVTDQADGWLYRFDGSGPADTAHRVGSAPLGSRPAGIAFDAQDHLYVVRYGNKDVVQVDPNTGAILRTVVSGLRCPFGLAPDPISGDLFLTEPSCNSNLMRIVNVASPAPFVVPFATGFAGPDGITSTPDGTIYVIEASPGRVVQVAGTASGTPGQKTTLATLSGADGLGIGAGSGSTPPFVIVNRTNGSVTRVDLASGSQSNTELVTGGSRGDFPAVGFDGCLYATQTDRVLKITAPNDTCGQGAGLLGRLLPSTPPKLSGGSNALRLPARKGCVDRRRFTFKLHHARGTRIVQADAFVNGKRKVHLRRRSITRITLKKLPKGKFRVRIVARQSNGSRKVSTRTYNGCAKSRPTTRSHRHRTRKHH